VEPARPFPPEALRQAAESRTSLVQPYQQSTSTFDIAFITPVLTYTAHYQATRGRPRTTSKDTRTRDPEPTLVRPLLDFANWSDYVFDSPPVLLVRVTPRLVEGFWTKLARGAAMAKGISIPSIKRPASGFSRLRAFCGGAEVVPIHPLKIEHPLPNGDTINEGLYAFDPGALGPGCGEVKLELFSVKDPDKPDTRVVDPAVVQQFWSDFAAHRRRDP
jgi:hypothetical protein